MFIRGSGLRFTAVTVMVVLALTGFSHGHHGSHSSHGHGGSGGGCSSSHQDHDSYSSSGSGGSGGGSSSYRRPRYRTTPASRPSASASASAYGSPAAGTVKLVSCASEGKPYATVQVTNPGGRANEFVVRVDFEDRAGTRLATNTARVTAPAGGTALAKVAVAPGLAREIAHCVPAPTASPG
ncbi:hypothetical protein AB0C59_19385 [Streptomyces sp. NPDC048664]|uniref:hypothetical protein n=1 Tax=Streptomyces sp. NPDC048664 TaxID=3154505 RepID=UPI003436049E